MAYSLPALPYAYDALEVRWSTYDMHDKSLQTILPLRLEPFSVQIRINHDPFPSLQPFIDTLTMNIHHTKHHQVGAFSSITRS